MRSVFTQIVLGMQEKAKESIVYEQGDYYSRDNLLYCGKCHTPKQCRLYGDIYDNGVMIVHVPCKHQQEEDNAIKQKEKEKERQQNINRLRKICFHGIYNSYLSAARFENDDNSNAKISKIARNYVKNFDELKRNGKGILFYGDVGRGKTFISACIANALIDENIPVLMTSFSRIASELQSDFDGRAEYTHWLNSFQLLVIDDFGTERSTEFMQEVIYTVIDGRYEARLPMIVTTNLSANDIRRTKSKDMFSLRVFDRILENCVGIEVDGNNRREALQKNNFSELKRILEM